MTTTGTPQSAQPEESEKDLRIPQSLLPMKNPQPKREEPSKDDPLLDEELILQATGEVEQEVLEIAGRDIERSRDSEDLLARKKAEKGESFYADLIYTLTHLRYEEKDARVFWVNLLSHKWEMSEKMGRNVGIRVAALDYFRNIIGALEKVKIMDASAYLETKQLAVTDGLTGIFNHRFFQDRLQRDIQRAAEEDDKVCLLMIDLDYFKTYNDLNGHIAGDVALKEIAAALRKNLKKDDMVARYGGEEFAVVLFGLDHAAGLQVAERLRWIMAKTNFPNQHVMPGGRLTISIGLAVYPDDAANRGELIACADRALYLAKRSGRNRVAAAPQENRAQPRRPCRSEIAFCPAEGVGTDSRAELVNVSSGGLCFNVQSPLAVGQVLRLNLPGTPPSSVILGRVVWQMIQPDGRAQIGLKFVNLNAETRAVLDLTLPRL